MKSFAKYWFVASVSFLVAVSILGVGSMHSLANRAIENLNIGSIIAERMLLCSFGISIAPAFFMAVIGALSLSKIYTKMRIFGWAVAGGVLSVPMVVIMVTVSEYVLHMV